MFQCLQHMLGVGQKGIFVMYQPNSTSVIIENSSLPWNDLEEVQRKNFLLQISSSGGNRLCKSDLCTEISRAVLQCSKPSEMHWQHMICSTAELGPLCASTYIWYIVCRHLQNSLSPNLQDFNISRMLWGLQRCFSRSLHRGLVKIM